MEDRGWLGSVRKVRLSAPSSVLRWAETVLSSVRRSSSHASRARLRPVFGKRAEAREWVRQLLQGCRRSKLRAPLFQARGQRGPARRQRPRPAQGRRGTVGRMPHGHRLPGRSPLCPTTQAQPGCVRGEARHRSGCWPSRSRSEPRQTAPGTVPAGPADLSVPRAAMERRSPKVRGGPTGPGPAGSQSLAPAAPSSKNYNPLVVALLARTTSGSFRERADECDECDHRRHRPDWRSASACIGGTGRGTLRSGSPAPESPVTEWPQRRGRQRRHSG